MRLPACASQRERERRLHGKLSMPAPPFETHKSIGKSCSHGLSQWKSITKEAKEEAKRKGQRGGL
jgi:hypothetical protein